MNPLSVLKAGVDIIDRQLPRPLFYTFYMRKHEKRLFKEITSESKNYLEFGIGGSTLCVLIHSQAKIYTVDSSMNWINKMRRYQLIRKAEPFRLNIHFADTGPVGEWGIPTGSDREDLFPNYSKSIFDQLNAYELDTIFIDGRFRVACALQSILQCRTNQRLCLLIHDFWSRPQYHVVLKYLDIVCRTGTLAVFRIKPGIDPVAVERDFQVYQYDWG